MCASRVLSKAERNLDIAVLEAKAAVYAREKFQNYLKDNLARPLGSRYLQREDEDFRDRDREVKEAAKAPWDSRHRAVQVTLKVRDQVRMLSLRTNKAQPNFSETLFTVKEVTGAKIKVRDSVTGKIDTREKDIGDQQQSKTVERRY